ncbi:MAG: molybdopterin converting factor subunit 1 [Chloroflexi bacterium]|nr:molybdopterin converting factor subunit 1 [Chloroflexota bacterium]
MRISIRLFASIREALGVPTLEIEVPAGATVGTLTREIRARYPQLPLQPEALVSVNYEYVRDDHPLRENDEVALIPPVSGGSGGFFEITDNELTAESVADLVRSPECGAVAVFLGTARRTSRGREVAYLEYEAYPEMAIRKLRQIAEEIRERWSTDRVAIRHRVGHIELGEASVAIAVATEHRAEGFAACQYAIDRLKEIVPIWKKEVWVGGGEWVGWDCAIDPLATAPAQSSLTER